MKVQKARLAITGRMVCMGLSSGVKDGRRNLLRLALAVLRTPRMGLIGLMGLMRLWAHGPYGTHGPMGPCRE